MDLYEIFFLGLRCLRLFMEQNKDDYTNVNVCHDDNNDYDDDDDDNDDEGDDDDEGEDDDEGDDDG